MAKMGSMGVDFSAFIVIILASRVGMAYFNSMASLLTSFPDMSPQCYVAFIVIPSDTRGSAANKSMITDCTKPTIFLYHELLARKSSMPALETAKAVSSTS